VEEVPASKFPAKNPVSQRSRKELKEQKQNPPDGVEPAEGGDDYLGNAHGAENHSQESARQDPEKKLKPEPQRFPSQ